MVSGKINLIFVPWDGTNELTTSPNPTLEMTDALSEKLKEINEGGFKLRIYVKRRMEEIQVLNETRVFADMSLSLRYDQVKTVVHIFDFDILMEDSAENTHRLIFMALRPPFVRFSFYPPDCFSDDYSCHEDIPQNELDYEEIHEHLYYNTHDAWRGPRVDLFSNFDGTYRLQVIEINNRQTTHKTKQEILAMDIYQIADWIKTMWVDDI